MKRKQRTKPKVRLEGDPILKTICEPVAPGEDISHITRDMRAILINSKTGIGLSANQVGYAKRVIAVMRGSGPQYDIMINPVIKRIVCEKTTKSEGCLSYPGKYVQVERDEEIFLAYEDEDGTVQDTDLFQGIHARVIQHECDHLDGKCIVGD